MTFSCLAGFFVSFSSEEVGWLRWWENWKQNHPQWKWVRLAFGVVLILEMPKIWDCGWKMLVPGSETDDTARKGTFKCLFVKRSETGLHYKERRRGEEVKTVYKRRENVHLGQSQVLKTSPPWTQTSLFPSCSVFYIVSLVNHHIKVQEMCKNASHVSCSFHFYYCIYIHRISLYSAKWCL